MRCGCAVSRGSACAGDDGEPGTCACVCVRVGGCGCGRDQVCVLGGGEQGLACRGGVSSWLFLPTPLDGAHLPGRTGPVLRGPTRGPIPEPVTQGRAAGCPWCGSGGMVRAARDLDSSWTLLAETTGGGQNAGRARTGGTGDHTVRSGTRARPLQSRPQGDQRTADRAAEAFG